MRVSHLYKIERKNNQAISRIPIFIVIALVVLAALVGGYWYVINNAPACVASVEGYALVIHVVNDSSGKPLSRATVSVLQINDCGNSTGSIFTTQTLALGEMVTRSNGTLYFPSPPAATHQIIIHYSGSSYNANFIVAPLKITSVTVSIPSGKSIVTYSLPP